MKVKILLVQLLVCFLVKQDLVYNSNSGKLVGFTDIGNRYNQRKGELATHALTVYVKSFCGKPGLKYPIAYFATAALTGGQLASIMWESVALLENLGLEVNLTSSVSHVLVLIHATIILTRAKAEFFIFFRFTPS